MSDFHAILRLIADEGGELRLHHATADESQQIAEAERKGLIKIRVSGWGDEQTLSLTAEGREALGLRKQSLWRRLLVR